MSFLVNLSVSFELTDNEQLAKLATEHLKFFESLSLIPTGKVVKVGTLKGNWDVYKELESNPPCEAIFFLEALAARTGTNRGTKGGMVTWGTVGNYTLVETFISSLDNFWSDLFNEKVDGFRRWQKILVLEQSEGSWLKAHEICLVPGPDKPPGQSPLMVKTHGPFTFGWRRGD